MQLEECPNWKTPKPTMGEGAVGEQILVPWTGSAMGLVDLGVIAGRSRPTVVTLLGAAKAGKTTILASWYMLIGRGLGPATRQFAGSYTLDGWETLSSPLRWAPEDPPRFPAHTTSNADRTPGLLHLAFRSADLRLRDVMFADAPGEWFRRWAINENADGAEGARWLADQADILLVVIDSEALAGPGVGPARGELQALAPRVAQHRLDRPVALVWAKSDVELDSEIELSVRRSMLRHLPDAQEFHVSVKPGKEGEPAPGVIALLDWILDAARPTSRLPVLHAADTQDSFLMLGRNI